MKRDLIVETKTAGHVLVFVRLLAEHSLKNGRLPVLLLSSSAVDAPEFDLHLGAIIDRCETHFAPLNCPIDFAEWARSTGANQVVIPDGDAHLLDLARAKYMGPPMSLLVMREPLWPKPLGLRQATKMLAKRTTMRWVNSRSCVSVYVLKPPGFTAKRDTYVNDPILATPDLEGGQRLRRDLGMDDDVFWFGVAGHITPRKNPGKVMRAIAAIADSKSIGFLCAGIIQDDAIAEFETGKSILSARGVPVRHLNGPLTNEEMNLSIAAMDCVVVAYDTSAPPSTMGKAYRLGTRCVISGNAQLRRQASWLGGATVVDRTDDSLQKAMTLALTSPRPGPRPLPERDVFAGRLLGDT